MLINRLLLVVVAACLPGAGCSGPDPRGPVNAGVPTYGCRFAAGPIKIDGSLDDPAWADAPFSADFIRRRVGVRIMPKNIHTRMKMLHDDANLYIGVECRDSDIWSTFTERDDPVLFEEAVSVYVDPLGNGRDYYGFYVNPLNALLDLKRHSPSLDMRWKIWLECTRWNAEGIEHAVQVDGTVNKRDDEDTGWTLEMKLPFSALGVRPRPDDRWRVQVGRNTVPRFSGMVLSSWARTESLSYPRDFGVLLFQE